jgi:pSer/pThr/pTyr-binding forkhead associated (FHA) protein
MIQPGRPGQASPAIDRSGTLLETDEDIRQALLSGLKGQQQNVPVEPRPSPNTGRPASQFRPTVRPPVPILTVFDDGKTDGEVIRLREPKFTIGRTEGDLRFPMDGRMSSRHVEITHQVVGGLHRWVVTDLQSKHGMFVRVSKTALADKAEFLVGNGRYRLDSNQPEPDTTADQVVGGPNTGETQGWADGPGPFRPPALTELLGQEIGNRVLLVKGEYWIGSDPTCPVCRPDDPFCDPKHVRLYRGSKGGWHAEHNKTQNGLWLRMAQITVESMIQFQIGEQRFKLKAQ